VVKSVCQSFMVVAPCGGLGCVPRTSSVGDERGLVAETRQDGTDGLLVRVSWVTRLVMALSTDVVRAGRSRAGGLRGVQL